MIPSHPLPSLRLAVVPLSFLAVLALAGCQQAEGIALEDLVVEAGAPQPDAGHAAPAHAVAMPTSSATAPVELPGLHNVVRYTDDVVSGSVPVGDEGFAALEAMGVRTVISVDGATPQVDLARRHGLRYVHLPISYDGVPQERAAGLARALSSLEGPFYVHCHHGKHRSAAAAAAGAICAGILTNEEAAARMKVSGTSPNYPLLWESVAAARPLPQGQRKADPASFPEIAVVSGMIAVMAELDVAFDNGKVLDANGWSPAPDHPDLVPAKETKRLSELFAGLKDDGESKALPDDYQQMLDEAIGLARELDAAVRAGDTARAREHFAAMGRSCKQCHKSYRDR